MENWWLSLAWLKMSGKVVCHHQATAVCSAVVRPIQASTICWMVGSGSKGRALKIFLHSVFAFDIASLLSSSSLADRQSICLSVVSQSLSMNFICFIHSLGHISNILLWSGAIWGIRQFGQHVLCLQGQP